MKHLLWEFSCEVLLDVVLHFQITLDHLETIAHFYTPFSNVHMWFVTDSLNATQMTQHGFVRQEKIHLDNVPACFFLTYECYEGESSTEGKSSFHLLSILFFFFF